MTALLTIEQHGWESKIREEKRWAFLGRKRTHHSRATITYSWVLLSALSVRDVIADGFLSRILPGLPLLVTRSHQNYITAIPHSWFLVVSHSNITAPCAISLFSLFLCMSRFYILEGFSPFLLKAIARRGSHSTFFLELRRCEIFSLWSS